MMDPRDLCLCWTASLLHPILEFCSSLLKSAGRGARRLAGGDDKQAWQGQVLVQVRLPNSGPKVACQAAAHDWTNSWGCGVCHSHFSNRVPVPSYPSNIKYSRTDLLTLATSPLAR